MNTTTITGEQTAALILLLIWSLLWKGIALWVAARNNDKAWYVALMLVNSVGILEMFYLFVFSKRNKKLNTTITS